MLDADNLPLRNPEALFETREYRRSGTLFFSDWWDMTEWVKPQAYTAFGLPYPGDEAAVLASESGQLFLNRRATHSHDLKRYPWKFDPEALDNASAHSLAGITAQGLTSSNSDLSKAGCPVP